MQFKPSDRVRYSPQALAGIARVGKQGRVRVPWDVRTGEVLKVNASRCYVVWEGNKTAEYIEQQHLVSA